MADPNPTTSRSPRYAGIKPGYRVGDDGSVWSCVEGGCKPRLGEVWRALKPHSNPSGHLRVSLGKGDLRYVHVLVLEAFVGPCPEGMECCHWDGDPSNNRLDNLRWDTPKANHADSVRHGTAVFAPGTSSTRGEGNPSSKLTEDQVREIDRLEKENRWGARSICREIGLPDVMRGAVDGIIRGQSWNHVTGRPAYKPASGRAGRPAEITAEQAASVVQMRRDGLTAAEIASAIGFSTGPVYAVLSGRLWGEVTGIAPKSPPPCKTPKHGRLTGPQIVEIVRLARSGVILKDIGVKFETSLVTIRKLLKGEIHADVSGVDPAEPVRMRRGRRKAEDVVPFPETLPISSQPPGEEDGGRNSATSEFRAPLSRPSGGGKPVQRSFF